MHRSDHNWWPRVWIRWTSFHYIKLHSRVCFSCENITHKERTTSSNPWNPYYRQLVLILVISQFVQIFPLAIQIGMEKTFYQEVEGETPFVTICALLYQGALARDLTVMLMVLNSTVGDTGTILMLWVNCIDESGYMSVPHQPFLVMTTSSVPRTSLSCTTNPATSAALLVWMWPYWMMIFLRIIFMLPLASM